MRLALAHFLTAAGAGVTGWLCGATEVSSSILTAPSATTAAATARIDAKPGMPAVVKVSTMDAASVQARLEALVASPVCSSVELRLLMAHWVATDLAGAKKWTLELPAGTGALHDPHARMLSEFFTSWARLDSLAAVTEAAGLKPSKTGTALRAIVTGLADADTATIAKVLEKLPRGPANWEPYGIHSLAKQLAVRDPAAAQSLALSLKRAAGDAAAKAVVEVLARTDPQAALTWAREHPQESARAAAVEAVLTEWARRDPAAVGPLLLQKTEGRPDKLLAEAAVTALRQLSAASPAEAAAFVEKFIPPEQIKTNLLTFFELLAFNPDAPGVAATLCACVARLSPAELKDARVFRSYWPNYEALGPAWDRLLVEPDSPARRFLLSQIGKMLITLHPAKAMQETMKLPDPALREELLAAALNGTGNFDTSGIADYDAGIAELRSTVASLPESLRARGSLRLAWAVAESDPRGAAEIIREYPSVAENSQFMQHLTGHFIRTSEPAEAQRWADSLPGEAAKVNAYSGITDAWYSQDSEAVSQWVNSLPPGTARDASAARLAFNGTRNSEPDTALAWAASVQDPARRATATADVVRYWARFDPALAEDVVSGSKLFGAEKNELLRILNQNR